MSSLLKDVRDLASSGGFWSRLTDNPGISIAVLKQVLAAIALDLKVKRPEPVVPQCPALETTWGQLEEYGMVTLEPQVRQLEHLVEVASVLRPVYDCCFFVIPMLQACIWARLQFLRQCSASIMRVCCCRLQTAVYISCTASSMRGITAAQGPPRRRSAPALAAASLQHLLLASVEKVLSLGRAGRGPRKAALPRQAAPLIRMPLGQSLALLQPLPAVIFHRAVRPCRLNACCRRPL